VSSSVRCVVFMSLQRISDHQVEDNSRRLDTDGRFGSLRALFELARPFFLIGGVTGTAVGVALAWYQTGQVNWRLAVLGQLAVSAIQLMTHFSNDYFDLEVDRLATVKTFFSGGSRVLPAGRLVPGVALVAALVCLAFGLGIAVVLELDPSSGALTLPLFVVTILTSWFYSAPPIRLCARGLGELSAALVVGLLSPLVAYYLQTARLTTEAGLVALPSVLAYLAMLLAVEFPDREADQWAGKRNLVVRLGRNRAGWLYVGAVVGIYLAALIVPRWGVPVWVGRSVWLSLPVGLALLYGVWRGAHHQSRQVAWLVGTTVFSAGLVTALIAMGLLVARWV
jgi:1,4-dihydroxy-2-naphthoate octaprenyltransferase